MQHKVYIPLHAYSPQKIAANQTPIDIVGMILDRICFCRALSSGKGSSSVALLLPSDRSLTGKPLTKDRFLE